jgi:acyl carrier protein
LLDHAQSVPAQRPLSSELSLRKDLAIESLSLVAVALRLGEELGVDMLESGIDLGRLDTVGDLVIIAHGLAQRSSEARG